MDPQSQIIQDLAKRECERISTCSIRHLQRMKRRSMLSGDDSGLKNVWDEICVQIQYDESIYWDAYVLTVDQTIEGYLFPLTFNVHMAIWLQTSEGRWWDPLEDDEPETLLEDIIRYIRRDFLFRKAETWTNSRIKAFLEHYM